jgi:hypothetical protein
VSPTQELFELSSNGWYSKVVAAAAELDLARLVADGPKTYTELAEATGTDPESLHILLGVLVTKGVFETDEDGRFHNSEISARLDDSHPESMRNLCRWLAVVYDAAWAGLVPMLRDGVSAFEHHYGKPLYEHLASNPEHERLFHLAMEDSTGPISGLLADRCDLSGARWAVDIGGGTGVLLKRLLSRYPEMRGTVADRAEICEPAGAELAASGSDLKDRLDFQVADMFGELPAGADIYLIKNVLHDWKPESVRRILQVIRTAATTPGARLLVIEPLPPKGSVPGHQLFKMVMCEEGSQLHSPEEMQEMIEEAKFQVTGTFLLPSGHTVLDCTVI